MGKKELMFNPEDYRSRFEDVKRLLTSKVRSVRVNNVRRVAAEIAITTGVPVAVVLIYIGEIKGFTDDIKAAIKDMDDFYGNK